MTSFNCTFLASFVDVDKAVCAACRDRDGGQSKCKQRYVCLCRDRRRHCNVLCYFFRFEWRQSCPVCVSVYFSVNIYAPTAPSLTPMTSPHHFFFACNCNFVVVSGGSSDRVFSDQWRPRWLHTKGTNTFHSSVHIFPYGQRHKSDVHTSSTCATFRLLSN